MRPGIGLRDSAAERGVENESTKPKMNDSEEQPS